MNVSLRMSKYCYLNLGAIHAKGLWSYKNVPFYTDALSPRNKTIPDRISDCVLDRYSKDGIEILKLTQFA